MIESTKNSVSLAGAEQGENPVKTGLEQAAAHLEELVGRWKKPDRNDVVLLRALCVLTMRHADRAGQGFTAQELAAMVNELRERNVLNELDLDLVSKWVRNGWKRLQQDVWPGNEEGVDQSFRDAGRASVRLHREEGGGTGRMTRYSLCIADEQFPEQAPSVDNTGNVPGIRYVPQDVRLLRWMRRLGVAGMPDELKGRWRLLLTVPALLGLLYLLAVILLALLGLAGGQVPGEWLTALFVTVVAIWPTVGPLLRLPEWRVVVAPWWLQADDDTQLLEWRTPPRYQEKSIVAVRYAAVCPVCGGRVFARSGGLGFPGRIVGRCEEAPAEHVFSFDHVTRTGQPLRSPVKVGG